MSELRLRFVQADGTFEDSSPITSSFVLIPREVLSEEGGYVIKQPQWQQVEVVDGEGTVVKVALKASEYPDRHVAKTMVRNLTGDLVENVPGGALMVTLDSSRGL